MLRESRSQVMENEKGELYLVFDEETKGNLSIIKSKAKEIFSKPFTEEECEILVDTIIYLQFTYSDDIADLEDVIQGSVDYFELLENRLKGGDEN